MIYPARATTREARTLDTSRNRTRTLQPQTEQQTDQQSARIQESSRGTTALAATGASVTPPATPPFRASLWDAFSGTPARPTAATPANSPATGTIPSATPTSTASASGARVDAATAAGTRGTATSAAPTSAGTTSAGTTRTITQNAEEAPVNPVPPNTELLTQVRAALNDVGLNPDQYNLRVGSLTISYPNIPTYEYPVLFADINGQTAGFYLNGVAQNPAMFAVNVSSMLGRPVMHQV
jgi:hypothetical protein